MAKLADICADAQYDAMKRRVNQGMASPRTDDNSYSRPVSNAPDPYSNWRKRLPEGFVPSGYQDAVFQAIIGPYEGHGPTCDILIEAVAGSGKTKTLEVASFLLPPDIQRRTLMTPFNAHIMEELKARKAAGKIPGNVGISTIHSFGLRTIKTRITPLDEKTWVNARKYRILSELAWSQVSIPPDLKADDAFRAKWVNARKDLEKLVSLAMLSLSGEDRGSLRALMMHHGIEIMTEAQEEVFAAVPRILKWGREGLPEPDSDGHTYSPSEMISFEDMVYLPTALDIDPPTYKLILVDEAQDLNAAQRTLMLRAKGKEGRIVFVGDRRQAIYAFAGADASSFDSVLRETGAKLLPLSICYRCATSVVAAAQDIVPQIEPSPYAPHGSVLRSEQKKFMDRAVSIWKEQPKHRAGWLLLCRTNAPLIGWAFALMRHGIPVTMTGRDILATLKSTIRDIRNAGLKGGIDTDEDIYGQFFASVPIYRQKESARLSREYSDPDALDTAIAQLYDRIDCAIAVAYAAKEAGITDWNAALEYVERIFEEHDGDVITLSSIHKAKGLECRNVALLHSELIPHPMVRQGWQLEQEDNLRYIAYTRAQERLYILEGKEDVE
jgi:DNA helicase-2/ATP-dependent DNA helicase PcrA